MAGLIGLDWGTSSLRGYLFGDDGAILDVRSKPWGVRSLPEGGFEAALAGITGDWPRAPRIGAGMVGGRGGWHEMPYLDVPIDVRAVGAALGTVNVADGGVLHLVPGLRDPRRPDVMRGEETQILGALGDDPSLAARSTLLLPGTHSKWAEVLDGHVAGFRTAMTGELYALLLRHSILGAGVGEAAGEDRAMFLRGVRDAQASGAAGALSRIFTVRAAMLAGQIATTDIPRYLSGLLIGEEIRGMLAEQGAPPSVVHPIGDAALCARYREALDVFGIASTPPLADAAAHGLWWIAVNAGLVDQAAGEALRQGAGA